jgi:hypothetical protein
MYPTNRKRKYSCDHEFFSRDTPESFYWAGFMAADGCIKSRSNTLSIGIAVKDKNHLDKFVAAVKYTGIVENTSWHDANDGVCVRISSHDITRDLARFNIVPKKTFVYRFPDWIIGHALVNHFMRGYFDGDGSVYFIHVPNKTKQCNFEILGTEHFVNVYSNILESECNVGLRIYKKKNIWHGRFCGNLKTQMVRRFLYQDATTNISLERKHDRFFDKEIGQSKRIRKVIGTNITTGENFVFNSITDAVDRGFGNQHICGCCNGYRKSCGGFTWKYVN